MFRVQYTLYLGSGFISVNSEAKWCALRPAAVLPLAQTSETSICVVIKSDISPRVMILPYVVLPCTRLPAV